MKVPHHLTVIDNLMHWGLCKGDIQLCQSCRDHEGGNIEGHVYSAWESAERLAWSVPRETRGYLVKSVLCPDTPTSSGTVPAPRLPSWPTWWAGTSGQWQEEICDWLRMKLVWTHGQQVQLALRMNWKRGDRISQMVRSGGFHTLENCWSEGKLPTMVALRKKKPDSQHWLTPYVWTRMWPQPSHSLSVIFLPSHSY